MSGKGFLKVTSVFMAIWGVINIVIGGLLLVGFGAATDIVADVQEKLMAAAIMLFIVIGICEILAAKFGFSAVNDASKAKKCLIMGFVVITFQIGTTFTGDISSVNVLSLIAPLVIPILYVVGALLRKANPEA